MTFDMRSRRFLNKLDYAMELPSKDICAQAYFP